MASPFHCGRCILLQLGIIIEQDAVVAIFSAKMISIFSMPSAFLTLISFGTIVVSLVMAGITITIQVRQDRQREFKTSMEQKARRLRWKSNNIEVVPTEIPGDWFHVFLSHVWSTGQDQVCERNTAHKQPSYCAQTAELHNHSHPPYAYYVLTISHTLRTLFSRALVLADAHCQATLARDDAEATVLPRCR